MNTQQTIETVALGCADELKAQGWDSAAGEYDIGAFHGDAEEMLTVDTITTEQIEALKAEAETAGDEQMAHICKRALCFSDEDGRAATQVCVDAINDAAAQRD